MTAFSISGAAYEVMQTGLDIDRYGAVMDYLFNMTQDTTLSENERVMALALLQIWMDRKVDVS